MGGVLEAPLHLEVIVPKPLFYMHIKSEAGSRAMTGQSPHSEPVSELRLRHRVSGPGHCPLPPYPYLPAGLMARAGTEAHLLVATAPLLVCGVCAAPTALGTVRASATSHSWLGCRCWNSAGLTSTPRPWRRSAASARPWTPGSMQTPTLLSFYTTRSERGPQGV